MKKVQFNLPFKTYKHYPVTASHKRHVQSTPAVITFVPYGLNLHLEISPS